MLGSIDVDASRWFFEAHFFEDPVWPGSLGLEAFLQLLKVYATHRFGLGSLARFSTIQPGAPHRWTYRGQILPTDRKVTLVANIESVDESTLTVVASRSAGGGRSGHLPHGAVWPHRPGRPRMKYTRVHIDAFGLELAPVVVTTAQIEDRLGDVLRTLRLPLGWLQQVTGIEQRRWWPSEFSLSEAAAQAAQNALTHSEVKAHEIGALVYGGVCREDFEPATACHVAARLAKRGLPIADDAAVFDVSNACLGVVGGIVEVANRIELGQITAGLVVSAETAREINDITIEGLQQAPTMERFTRSIATFTGGSGAVAVLVRDATQTRSPRRQLLGGATASDPSQHMLCRWGVRKPAVPISLSHAEQFASTDSAAVLEHGVALGVRTWARFLKALGWSAPDIDRTVCHQIGAAHRDTMLRTLEVSPDRDFITYPWLGNMGTVSLPMSAALAEQRGFLRPGHTVGLLGIGSGLNCTMLGVQW